MALWELRGEGWVGDFVSDDGGSFISGSSRHGS